MLKMGCSLLFPVPRISIMWFVVHFLRLCLIASSAEASDGLLWMYRGRIWPKEVPRHGDRQTEHHGQNLEVTHGGTKSSHPLHAKASIKDTIYIAATQEMIMRLKNSHLVMSKSEHINHRFGTMLCKQMCFTSPIK